MGSLSPALILHLDLNKTMLMIDPASNASSHNVLVSLICSCAWGSIDDTAHPASWALASEILSVAAPHRKSAGRRQMTYDSFVCDVLYPFKRPAADVREAIDGLEAFNKEQKKVLAMDVLR